jgi:ribonuclease PH
MRPVTIETGYLQTAEGSTLISVGNTRVLCAASVEDGVPQFLRGTGRGWVTAEYSMLPRATARRTPREIAKGRPSGRTQEIQRLIGRSLRAVVDTAALGERTVIVDCDVLQADGGTRTASITGAFVAMGLAMERLRQTNRLNIQPIKDYLAAVSVGVVEGAPVLDLCYLEDAQAEVDMNMVLTGSGDFVEIQGTAESKPFSMDAFFEMQDLAAQGIRQLIQVQKDLLKLEFTPPVAPGA